MDKIKEYKPELEKSKAFTPDIIPGVNAPLINAPTSLKNYKSGLADVITLNTTTTVEIKGMPKMATIYAKNSAGTINSIMTWTPSGFSRITFRATTPFSMDNLAVDGESFTITKTGGKYYIQLANQYTVTLTFYLIY